MAKLIQLPNPRPARRMAAQQQRWGDQDLLLVGGLLWVASVARVILALVHHERFEAEATLALGCVLGLPWLLFRSLTRRRSPAGADSKQSGHSDTRGAAEARRHEDP